MGGWTGRLHKFSRCLSILLAVALSGSRLNISGPQRATAQSPPAKAATDAAAGAPTTGATSVRDLGQRPPHEAGPAGQSGGAAHADFDKRINVIQTTIATDTWADVGGTG